MPRWKGNDRPEVYPPVPDELLVFRPDDWVGEPEPWAAWRAARRAFVAEHGDSTMLGDILDLLRDEVAEKRRLAAPGAPLRPGVHITPDMSDEEKIRRLREGGFEL